MKKTAVLIMIAIMILIVGCSGKGNGEKKNTNEGIIEKNSSVQNESKPETADKKRVALVMKTLTNPFFVEMEKGARKAEEESKIELIVKTGAKETSIEQQISIVEELINEKIDAIVIAPADSTKLIPALKKAQDSGIKIVNIDNRLDKEMMAKIGLKDVPFISVDNLNSSYLAAKEMCAAIKGETKAAVIEGIRGANNAEQRKEGILKAIKEKSNIKIAAMESANWKIDEANEVTAKIFKKTPDIKAVFCANDMMALGVIQYLETSGKKGVMVMGYDAIADAMDAVKNKKLYVTVNQQADVQGYSGVMTALKLINNEKVEPEILIDVKIVKE